MNIKPITPQEATAKASSNIPDTIIASFNEMIAENLSGGSARFTQDAVIKRILSNLKVEGESFSANTRPHWCTAGRGDLFQNNWLDVEPIFEAAGWKVEYDKPAYCESYDAFFVFRKK